MTGPTEPTPTLTQTGRYELGRQRARRLVSQALAFTGGFTSASLWCAVAGLSAQWSLPVALGFGLLFARPRRILRAPLLLGAGLAAVATAAWLGAPTAFAAAGTMGALAGWDRNRIEQANGVFAGLAGVGLGLLATQAASLPALAETVLFGSLASLILVPSALVWRPRAKVPSARHIGLTLRPPFRPPPLRAREIYEHLKANRPEPTTLDGLAEVSMWVYDLGRSLQSLEKELSSVFWNASNSCAWRPTRPKTTSPASASWPPHGTSSPFWATPSRSVWNMPEPSRCRSTRSPTSKKPGWDSPWPAHSPATRLQVAWGKCWTGSAVTPRRAKPGARPPARSVWRSRLDPGVQVQFVQRAASLASTVDVEDGARPEPANEHGPGGPARHHKASPIALGDRPALGNVGAQRCADQRVGHVQKPERGSPQQDAAQHTVEVGLVDVGLYPSRSTT